MTILAMILLLTAAALVAVGRMLRHRQYEASRNLAEKLEETAKAQTEAEDDGESQSDWDTQWDEAEAAIDEDFYRLLNTTSGIFRWLAVGIAVIAIILLVLSRL